MKTDQLSSDLVDAAQALETELKRFQVLAENIERQPFNSEKNLGRASRTLSEIAAVGETLQTRLGSLVSVIAGFRDKQQALAEAVQKRAEELQQRSQVLDDLLAEYRAIGEKARDLNEHLRLLQADQQPSGRSPYGFLSNLQDLEAKVGQLTEGAQSLFTKAQGDCFIDVAHQADALRQQLEAVRNRLGLLRSHLPQA